MENSNQSDKTNEDQYKLEALELLKKMGGTVMQSANMTEGYDWSKDLKNNTK